MPPTMRMPSGIATIGACLVVGAAMAVTLVAQAQQPAAGAQGRGQAPPAPQQRMPGHGMGQLVLWGDVSLFEKPGTPDNCILTNRFRKGQRVGFRMTAIDGGTGQTENTATLTVHVTYAGKTVDVPMRYRGGAPNAPRGYLRVPNELWTGAWTVPDDAPTGTVTYTVTATDAFGRKATFQTFPYETSQITIVG
jgi:hypothetical protein